MCVIMIRYVYNNYCSIVIILFIIIIIYKKISMTLC